MESGHELSPWYFFGLACLIMIALAVFAALSTRRLQKIPSSRNQNFVELMVSSLNNFVVGIIGPKGEKYTPFIGTLFIYILCMNLLGLIPGFKSPTSSLSITASLALLVYVVYNVAGIMETGFRSWFMHFVGEPLWLAPLMFPIHVIGDIARPVSLAIRLYGNIFGEETIIAILASMSPFLIKHFIAVPVQWPMMIFSIFTAFVQAMVFSMLTAIYISIAITGHEAH